MPASESSRKQKMTGSKRMRMPFFDRSSEPVTQMPVNFKRWSMANVMCESDLEIQYKKLATKGATKLCKVWGVGEIPIGTVNLSSTESRKGKFMQGLVKRSKATHWAKYLTWEAQIVGNSRHRNFSVYMRLINIYSKYNTNVEMKCGEPSPWHDPTLANLRTSKDLRIEA